MFIRLCVAACHLSIVVSPTRDTLRWSKYSSDPFFEVCRPHISDESETNVTIVLAWVVRKVMGQKGK